MAHKRLLENPQVKRWYDNLSRKSELTANVYLRRLGLFCKKWCLTPADLLQKDPQEVHSLLVDTVTELERDNRSPDGAAHDSSSILSGGDQQPTNQPLTPSTIF